MKKLSLLGFVIEENRHFYMALKPKKTRICFTSHNRDSFYGLLLKKFGNPFEGSYAYVFVSESYAVKMFRDLDPAFERYLTFVLANQNNPYVPKIFKIVIGVGFKCIVMERLNHLCHDVRDDHKTKNLCWSEFHRGRRIPEDQTFFDFQLDRILEDLRSIGVID